MVGNDGDDDEVDDDSSDAVEVEVGDDNRAVTGGEGDRRSKDAW